MTTIDELIEQLEHMRDEIHSLEPAGRVVEIEMRLATNPAWGMQHSVDSQLAWRVDENGDVAVYIADAGQIHGDPYLPGEISEQLGWA